MRRIIAVLILLLTFSTASYGAESEDMSVYVRKDVFDVHMQNITSKLDMILEEQKAQRQEINSMKGDIQELTKNIAVLSERIDRNFDTLSSRIDRVEASLSARIDGVEASLSAQIKGTNVRIDDLRNGMYLWLVIIGTIISAILAWPKVKEVIQTRSAGRKYLTLEDVMHLIEENNAKLGRSSQG